MQSLLLILPIRLILFTNIQKSLDSDLFCLFFVQNKNLLTKTRSNWNLIFIISIKRKEPDFNLVSLGLSLDVLIYIKGKVNPEHDDWV